MKKTLSIHSIVSACLGIGVLAGVTITDTAQGATLRYRQSGDWTLITSGADPGWGLNPNNTGAAGTSLPVAADVGRINWGNNTVTVTTSEIIGRLQIGVDEKGNLVIASTGSLTTVPGSGQNGDVIVGNGNNAAGTATMTVQSGGSLTVSNILYHGLGASGSSSIAGTVNVISHLWTGWGAGLTGTINITNGGILNVTGQIGLNWQNNGAIGLVNVMDGGTLNLAQIHPTDSIRGTSKLDIAGSGVVTINGDQSTVASNYVTGLKITSYGGLGTVGIDYNNTNSGKTTLFAIAPAAPPATNAVWNPALNVGDTNGLWNNSTNWDVAQVPSIITKVQFKETNAIPCTITNAASALQIVVGDNGPGGELILNSGGSLTTAGSIWSAVGYNSNALMRVNSGATASFGSHLWVGLNPNGEGTLIIDGGTVNVGGAFGMGTGGGTGYAYVTNGGILNITTWNDFGSVVGTSILDVSGSSQVIMNGNKKLSVEVDVGSGLITANGGTGTVVVDYDNINAGKTTIYALGASLVPQQAYWDTSLNPGDLDGLWTVSSNWTGGFVPGSTTRARFNIEGSLPCTLTTSAVAGRVTMGENSGSGGSLTITNGATLTVGSSDWSAIGYSSNAVMRVENGSTVSFGFQLWIGFNPNADGTLIINTGTVSVASMIGLGWNGGKGTVQVNNGTLNLGQFNGSQSISGASVLDVSGTGKVYITGDHLTSVSNYVSTGKITANGGPTVYYAYNAGTNITTISATPLALPPPPAQSITSVTAGGGNVSLTYQTTAGYTYHIEATPSLAPATWATVPGSTTNATGAPITFVIPVVPGTNTMFYRTVSP